jgi:hypothetical protein
LRAKLIGVTAKGILTLGAAHHQFHIPILVATDRLGHK